jgi:hypothetical protein
MTDKNTVLENQHKRFRVDKAKNCLKAAELPPFLSQINQ